MTSSPTLESSTPRRLRVRRWRTILAGGVLAGVGFVAAQAGSFDFLRLEIAQLAKAVDQEKATVVRGPSTGQGRRYFSVPAGHPADGAFVGAARNAAGSAGLATDSDGVTATGEATVDAVDLFELPPGAAMTSPAASEGFQQSGERFRSLVQGSGSGGGHSAASGGAGRQRARDGLADCCNDPATPLGDPLLTAPILADVVGGPVPEVGSWILMILGFGLSGAVLRVQRRTLFA
ncbi:MAG: hypothetical protein ACREE0_07860 [Phenylobacterium sp.]